MVEAGSLAVVGVVQEQHPDRARLYAAWRGIDWPILVDSLNLLDLSAVPIVLGLDERGVVRETRPRPGDLARFVGATYSAIETPPGLNDAVVPTGAPAAFFEGDYTRALELFAGDDPRDVFRRGVAHRARADSERRRPGDEQAAIDLWYEALRREPNQYIWRRRLQQYGPRLDQPYDFYGWVEEARAAIRARGGEPPVLAAEPMGAEVAAWSDGGEVPDPDPDGRLSRDERLVDVEVAVTPPAVPPGGRARVRATFRLRDARWNNEADPLQLSLRLAAGAALGEGRLVHPQAPAAESSEVRTIEFEIRAPDLAPDGDLEISAYAVYSVCEESGGVCLFVRRDLRIAIRIDSAATPIR